MTEIKIGIIGVGNCASSLVQGIHYYRDKQSDEAIGLMHWDVGGYKPFDVEVVAAFDIDVRKVNKDVTTAIFSPPNCTTVFCSVIPETNTRVQMGPVLDGYSDHMSNYVDPETFVLSDEPALTKNQVVTVLQEAGTEILMNYLPVGAEKATHFYAECAIDAGCAFINNIPVFIASDPSWASRFEQAGLPIIGDDIKAQAGATIIHRALVDLFKNRGVWLDRTYQLNTGGNTDFLNMLNHERLASKKTSKTEAVQAVTAERLADTNIHVGPSDYVAWQKDNKVCFIRMEGRLFGDVPMDLELRLSVEDSPNSAGVAIDAIRCARLALDRGDSGVLYGPSSYFCKHPPQQVTDDIAKQQTEAYIHNQRSTPNIRSTISHPEKYSVLG